VQYSGIMCSVEMGDSDFSAAIMCCVCGGGVQACMNTDFGSTDMKGRTCANYTYDTCLAQEQEHSDPFKANELCCICKGGAIDSGRTTTVTTQRVANSSGIMMIGEPLLFDEPSLPAPMVQPNTEVSQAASMGPAGLIFVLIASICCLGACIRRMLRQHHHHHWQASQSLAGSAADMSEASVTHKVEPAQERPCFHIAELNDRVMPGFAPPAAIPTQSVAFVASGERTSMGLGSAGYSAERTGMGLGSTSYSAERTSMGMGAAGYSAVVPRQTPRKPMPTTEFPHGDRRAGDEASEATSVSVYATTCELLKRVDFTTEQVSFDFSSPSNDRKRDKAEAAAAVAPSQALDGRWLQSGHDGISATVRDGVAQILMPAGEQTCRVTVLEDGRVYFEGAGASRYAQLVGDRLLWASGETWRRAGGSGVGGGGAAAASSFDGFCGGGLHSDDLKVPSETCSFRSYQLNIHGDNLRL